VNYLGAADLIEMYRNVLFCTKRVFSTAFKIPFVSREEKQKNAFKNSFEVS
jgi:hypothetical protein